jgi:alpha-2-macroglobulin
MSPKPYHYGLCKEAVYLSFFVFCFSFFISCHNRNDIRVVGQNFEDEIQLAQNLIFTFNKDIVPASDLNSWEGTNYVEFTPAVEGKYQWTATNELVFSPTKGFDPATDYKAELTSDLSKAAKGKGFGVSGEVLKFHTPHLQLLNTESYWSKSPSTGKPLAKTKFRFNYAINGGDLTTKLKLTAASGGGAFSHTVTDAQVSDEIAVAIATEASDEAAIPFKITLEKGLKVPNTTYQTTAPFEAEAVLPSMRQLDITNIETGFKDNRGFVRVIATQTIQNESIKNGFTVEPFIETTTELTDNGFVIRGNFSQNETYILTLNETIRGVLGAKLTEEIKKDLYFGEMPATINFANKKAIYLSAKGTKNVGVNITNVPKVNVKISKIYENNILAFLRSNRWEDYNYNEETNTSTPNGFNYGSDDGNLYSDVIVDKTIETSNLTKIGGASALNLAIPESNNFRGVYLVTVGSKDEQYLGATKLVSISDIGLITKKSKNELWVFANSIRSAEPLGGVEISLISTNNQNIITTKTDANGLAKFEELNIKAPNFKMGMIIAKTPEDFNYLALSDTEVETSRFEVDGKRDNTADLEAFIYGDRDIYRPGETIHYNTVVRTQNWKTAQDIPLKIRVLMPNGRELSVFRKNTNGQGAVETSLTLDNAAVTGTYSLEVLNGNDVLLASKNISVEEFMPDRIKVEPKIDKEFYKTGQTINLTATALNLFGPPASGRNYEMEFSLKRKAFTPKQFKEYVFSVNGETKIENQVRQGTTDEAGLAREGFVVPAALQDIGLLEGKVYVTVFDETGRPVNRLKKVDVLTQDIFYGIRLNDYYVGLNAALPVALVAVNKDGVLQNTTAQTEVIRVDYQTVVEKSGDYLRYTSRRREKVVYSNLVRFEAGKAELRYVPTVSGEYEVRVRRGAGVAGYSSANFYAYGWGSTSPSSFEVSNEGEVLMEFDKPTYEVGDKAKVLFKTPFNGKILVTIERNKILEYKYLQTDNKAAEFSFSVGEAHLPNVFVTATLIRPLTASNMPLMVAHGFAPLKVEDTDTKLPVEIVAVEKSRSKTKQLIKVKSTRNSQVTLAIVDEGILQLKNFQTPDIHGFFYQKRALEVGSFDLYAFLFPELSLVSSSSGGDGYDLEKRINPLSNGRVQLVTFWSGQLDTGLDGEAEFEVNIPQFSGDLRIMAVAYKDNAFGSNFKNMKVADPVVISTALPRFLSPGDEITVPVNVSNTEKTQAHVKVSLQINGALTQNATLATQNLNIAPEKEGRTNFTIKAAPMMGSGTVTVTVDNGKEKFTEKTALTIRPASSLLKTSQSGVIAGNSSGTIEMSARDFVAGTVKRKLIVSRSPMVQYSQTLDYLLGYPHGCIEQTISKAFPQLYFADIAKTISPKTVVSHVKESEFNPTFNIQAAIQKIESMQLPNGAVSYWPTQTTESAFGSAYAAHFLIEAQKAGYEVNQAALGRLMNFLMNFTSTPQTENEYIPNESGGYTVQSIASRTSLYALYTLALTGKPNRATMNYYKQNQQLLTPDSRYLLAATYKQIGDLRAAPQPLKGDLGMTGIRNLGGSFSSPIRNLALVLNTLLDTDPTNLQVPILARQLSQVLNTNGYMNTQESAFTFLALGKMAKKNTAATVTAKILTGGKEVASFDGKDLVISNVEMVNRQSKIVTSNKGSLYWFMQSEGLSANNTYTEEDVNLRVRKQFLNRKGQPISTFRQNDLVVVKITLSSGATLENVVVTDLLPAAFEVENPRLTEPRDMPWIKNATTPDHFDIRDDRINYYTTADNSEKTFYYMVRIVTKGTFALGPVSADAMYSSDYRSYHGGGKLRVE